MRWSILWLKAPSLTICWDYTIRAAPGLSGRTNMCEGFMVTGDVPGLEQEASNHLQWLDRTNLSPGFLPLGGSWYHSAVIDEVYSACWPLGPQSTFLVIISLHKVLSIFCIEFILVQLTAHLSLSGLPVFTYLYKLTPMHKRTNSQHCEFCVL